MVLLLRQVLRDRHAALLRAAEQDGGGSSGGLTIAMMLRGLLVCVLMGAASAYVLVALVEEELAFHLGSARVALAVAQVPPMFSPRPCPSRARVALEKHFVVARNRAILMCWYHRMGRHVDVISGHASDRAASMVSGAFHLRLGWVQLMGPSDSGPCASVFRPSLIAEAPVPWSGPSRCLGMSHGLSGCQPGQQLLICPCDRIQLT